MQYALGALVVLAVLAFVVLPIVRRGKPRSEAAPVAGPAETRATIYRELLELELDQKVGKIAEADYRELSEALLMRAASLISDEDGLPAPEDDEVERAIAQARLSLRQVDAPTAEAGNRP
jgi:hypothetical protein